MPRNGSGTFTPVNTFSSLATITALGHNQNYADIAAEITNSLPRDGQAGMLGPLRLDPGTVSLPGLAFVGDTNTGLYRIGADNIGVACNGAKVLDIGTGGADVTDRLRVLGTTTASISIRTTGSNNPELKLYDTTDGGFTWFNQDGGIFLGRLNTSGAWTENLLSVATNGTATFAGALASLAHTITSAAAAALAVGRQGATDPALKVDASASNAVTGLSIVSAAAAGGLALAVISSGTNENLTINAKGSGTIGIGSVSTGAVTITPATTITGALTASNAAGIAAVNTDKAYGCVTISGTTPTLQSPSHNASGVTRHGQGDYTFTMTNALASVRFVANITIVDSSGNARIATITAKTTTTVRFFIRSDSGSAVDPEGFDITVTGG